MWSCGRPVTQQEGGPLARDHLGSLGHSPPPAPRPPTPVSGSEPGKQCFQPVSQMNLTSSLALGRTLSLTSHNHKEVTFPYLVSCPLTLIHFCMKWSHCAPGAGEEQSGLCVGGSGSLAPDTLSGRRPLSPPRLSPCPALSWSPETLAVVCDLSGFCSKRVFSAVFFFFFPFFFKQLLCFCISSCVDAHTYILCCRD